MSVLDNWQEWKKFLGNRMDNALHRGMPEEAINKLAYEIGDYLQANVEPKNEQERVLADLWSVADESEQKVLASCMMKLVQK
ncbi:DUF3243 domain-containing protein [Domibacillus sp. DTU_2020_1001157_1_SI_ALB_TIR_016]|uniref:DUF3243 domain-containing protein n=1 Tax=Domibacillus sp. DTU_2020_1001157_1_SI_ALB_TIR_016 TaxID=3077789 RepID=UPI0028E8A27E|nr:DUF3243 domain-containing protein [Domibacillus sp. DTU_2020_1001157_1_SI_ALB_TIR_016]WNS79667.1 DUF3243 domain-containing protein [Domibacillus sp. DTU_2020_1001157_1_SI_ALB_TIR_016]